MRRAAIFGALALLVLCGCKKGPSFVGTWTTDVPTLGALTVHLNEDKTMTADAAKTVGPATIKIHEVGTWSSTDKDITTTVQDVKLEGVPPQFQSIADGQIGAMKGKSSTGTFTWNGDDEFSVTGAGATQKFARVKAGS